MTLNIFLAKECEDEPDDGANAGATRVWDSSKLFMTNMTYKCPYGKSKMLITRHKNPCLIQ